MNYVVDASVVIKWVVDEAASDMARRLAAESQKLYAPNLLLAEIANIAWRKNRLGEINATQASMIVRGTRATKIEFISEAPTINRALEIAIELDHPAYDAIYLACSETARAPLVTADARLLKTVAKTKYAPLVRHVSNFATPQP